MISPFWLIKIQLENSNFVVINSPSFETYTKVIEALDKYRRSFFGRHRYFELDGSPKVTLDLYRVCWVSAEFIQSNKAVSDEKKNCQPE